MIYPAISATACCDDDSGCSEKKSCRLVLGLSGSLMFEASDLPGWQLIMRGRPGSPVELRCPAHARKVASAGEQVTTLASATAIKDKIGKA
jgi:hypothetical protein